MRIINADVIPYSDVIIYGRKLVDKDTIDRLTTIDLESLRPKGEWVDLEWSPSWQTMTATCSNCHERGEVRVKKNECGEVVINSPCCPNCGARMGGGG